MSRQEPVERAKLPLQTTALCVAAMLAVAAAAVFAGLWMYERERLRARTSAPKPRPVEQADEDEASLCALSLPALMKKVEPAIVLVVICDEHGTDLGQGTGFFVSRDGDVVTNLHVIAGATQATVTTSDGAAFPVRAIVAENRQADLIRLSVETSGARVTALPISAFLPERGEHVALIGNPLDARQKTADGTVSAVRNDPSVGKILKMSVPISPGSSGSPVVNMKGEVVGVASFQFRAGQSLRFAVSAEQVTKLVPVGERSLADERRQWLASAEGFFWTGTQALKEEDYDKAVSCFRKAISKKPNDALAHYALGAAYLETGKLDLATEKYEVLVQLNEALAEELLALIEACRVKEVAAKKEREEAEAMLRETLGGPTAADIQIIEWRSETRRKFDWIEDSMVLWISGELKNNSQMSAMVKLQAVARDKTGAIVDSCEFYPTYSKIPAGERWRFTYGWWPIDKNMDKVTLAVFKVW
ncbi:MAG: trypsin-like peptidase domain-containing protein [Planctomycetota bacterium]|nr:trypsin-like peptidase domain-containing protein [Planctomycetota bacterium]